MSGRSTRQSAKETGGEIQKESADATVGPVVHSRVISEGGRSARVVRREISIAATDGVLHWMTAVLAILAMAIFLVADADGGRSGLRMSVQFCLEAILTLTGVIIVRRLIRMRDLTPYVAPTLILMVLLSLAWEPLQRWALLAGRPFEMMIMHGQKNLMLMLAIFGYRPSSQKLSVFIGVTLAIFCASVGKGTALIFLITVYAFSVISWLTASYWKGIQHRLLHSDNPGLPWRWLILVPALPLLTLLVASAGGHDIARSVRGYLPGSGGDGRYDEFSRGGVNDGEALVAGMNDIRSFGAIDEAPFADDDKPSLYDVINDRFDEPVRRNRNQQRAVALPPGLMADIKARMAEAQKAGRQFSTDRQSSFAKRQRMQSTRSPALFYLNGRVPLHLRMEIYDVFDGVDWFPCAVTDEPTGMAIVKTHGVPWLRIPCGNRGLGVHVFRDHHIVRNVNLRSNVIPAPLDTRALHIEHVEDASLFGWHRPSIVCMNRDVLPELTPVHLAWEVVDSRRLLDELGLPMSASVRGPENTLADDSVMRRIAALADEWTRDVPPGYQRVKVICDRLRSEYQLADSETDGTTTMEQVQGGVAETPLEQFLFRTRRGEEYLFATAAAMMIRSLGYSSRLVSGFYARAEQYDPRHRHTPVTSADAHFWCEVCIGPGTWVTVEPSPGYEVLAPPPGFLQIVGEAILAVPRFLLKHWILSLCGLLVICGVLRYRIGLLDSMETLYCRWMPAGNSDALIGRVFRLLEHRLNRAGLRRPPGMTLRRWMRQHWHATDPALTQYLTISDSVRFDPERRIPDPQVVQEVCRQVILRVSQRDLIRFQEAGEGCPGPSY